MREQRKIAVAEVEHDMISGRGVDRDAHARRAGNGLWGAVAGLDHGSVGDRVDRSVKAGIALDLVGGADEGALLRVELDEVDGETLCDGGMSIEGHDGAAMRGQFVAAAIERDPIRSAQRGIDNDRLVAVHAVSTPSKMTDAGRPSFGSSGAALCSSPPGAT